MMKKVSMPVLKIISNVTCMKLVYSLIPTPQVDATDHPAQC